jgi:phosphoenolpyruvate carboxykinase (GTP)
MIDRCKGAGGAVESPIGWLPGPGAIDTSGLDVTAATMDELLSVSQAEWRTEAEGIGEFFAKFGPRLPAEMERQRQALFARLGRS